MLPDFTMLIGIPGCGKSTWLFKNALPEEIVCPDLIRKEMANGTYDQNINYLVWIEAKKRTNEMLRANQRVFLDATNVNIAERRDFMNSIEAPCRKFAKVFYVHPEVACERIRKDLESGRDRAPVPESAVYRMYENYIQTIKVIRTEGFILL